MDMLRHVAKIANTDQRCVVAFMQIPGREDHALVIPTDNLPPRFEQAVMDVLKSTQGQQEEDFAVALSRHLMPDTGQNIFETLHLQKRLVPVPVHQVLMMPSPNAPVKLSSILETLGRLPNQQTEGLLQEYAKEKFNPHINNQVASSNEQSRAIARNLIVEAEMLELDARRKRDQAYAIDGSLRPIMPPVMAMPQVAPQAVEQPLRDEAEPELLAEIKKKGEIVNSDAIIERILLERQRHFNMPYREQDVLNTPNDWVAIIGRYVFEETRRGIVKPDQQNFEDNLVKAGAVLLAALEHCEMMRREGHFADEG